MTRLVSPISLILAVLAAALTACRASPAPVAQWRRVALARPASSPVHPLATPSPQPIPKPTVALHRTSPPPFPLFTPNPPTRRVWTPVADYLDSRSGETSVAVYDATTRRTYVFGATEAFACASIVKVQIMATVLHGSEHGEALSSDDRSQMTSMIEISDNDAATSLWQRAGFAGGLGAFDRLASMTQTVPDPYGAWGDTQTTALDQLRLLATIAYPNHLLDAEDRAFAMELMEHVDPAQDWGVSAGVSDGSTVALKNGWLPAREGGWVVNSVGAVSGEGRDYLIAVLSQEDPSFDYGIETIEKVSSIVWRSVHAELGD